MLIYLEFGAGLVIVARSRCVIDATLKVSDSSRSSCGKLQHIGGKTAPTELDHCFASKMLFVAQRRIVAVRQSSIKGMA